MSSHAPSCTQTTGWAYPDHLARAVVCGLRSVVQSGPSPHIFPLTSSQFTQSNAVEQTLEAALPLSCEQLVKSAKAGDRAAFDQLVGLHQDAVYNLARGILGSREDAADVQQETFIRAWRSLHRFRGDARFSTWLHSITVNLCLSRKRRCDIEVPQDWIDESLPDRSTSSPVASVERTETIAAVRRVLSAMPAHYRVLIVLRDMEGRSYEEICQILGCSAISARVRLSKARSLLREKMRPYVVEE